MEPVTSIIGPVSVLDRDDVDTDQIIPKQFLKRIERTGFGEFLFYDWKHEPGWDLPAQPDPRRGAQLRLRLVARARARGRSRTTASRRSSRRRSPTSSLQLHEDRAAAGHAARGRRATRSPPPAAPRSTSRRRRSRFGDGQRRALRDRRRDQAPPAQRPRRHRAHAAAGRRDRRLRAARRAPGARHQRGDGVKDIALLPGDGIGPEVAAAAVEVLDALVPASSPSPSTRSAAPRSTCTARR